MSATLVISPDEPSPTFSFVLPVHDEREGLIELHARLGAVMDQLGEPCEAIMVDDGSHDGSFDVMRRIHSRDPRFKLVQLSRNFGNQAAITAGLDLAQGSAVIVMDADLQHPPEIVPTMVSRWREGFEIVVAACENPHGESRFKRISGRLFYGLMRRLAQVEIVPNAGDFRLVDRCALEAFKTMRESTRYLRGMFSWIGFRQIVIPYEYHRRVSNTSKYNLTRMVRLGVDGISSFSHVPLQIALHVGFVVAILSFLAAVGDVVAKIVGADNVPGWLSLTITVSFLGGMQLVILGVMGTYMGRMYDEVKHRPLYVVRELVGIKTPETVQTPEIVQTRSIVNGR
jgi:glycosyltransferase involved in cell wall biosynthesis